MSRELGIPHVFSMKLAIILPALCGFALPVLSQTTVPSLVKPEMPSGPLLRSPANFSRWEIVSTSRAEGAKKVKSLRKTKPLSPSGVSRSQKTINTKTGRIIHEERIDALQHVTDTWFDGGIQYSRSDNDPIWYRSDGSSAGASSDYHPLPAIGYRGVDLITAENYAGTVFHNDKRCFVFVSGGYQKVNLHGAGNPEKKLDALEVVAYVDVETRLPVELRMPGELRTFQFDEPPTQMQTLPADLAAQIKRGEEGRKRLNQLASRPY